MINSESGPEMINAEKVAAELGLCKTKVYLLAAAGEIPSIRVGRAVRFPRRALAQWLAEQTAKAMSATTDHDAGSKSGNSDIQSMRV